MTPSPRIPLNLDIEYKRSYARSNLKGTLKNISLTGAFLACDTHELSVQEKIMVILQVGSRIRKVAASIVWKNEFGTGVQFKPFNQRDNQIIDDIMYFVESKREDQSGLLTSILKQVA